MLPNVVASHLILERWALQQWPNPKSNLPWRLRWHRPRVSWVHPCRAAFSNMDGRRRVLKRRDRSIAKRSSTPSRAWVEWFDDFDSKPNSLFVSFDFFIIFTCHEITSDQNGSTTLLSPFLNIHVFFFICHRGNRGSGQAFLSGHSKKRGVFGCHRGGCSIKGGRFGGELGGWMGTITHSRRYIRSIFLTSPSCFYFSFISFSLSPHLFPYLSTLLQSSMILWVRGGAKRKICAGKNDPTKIFFYERWTLREMVLAGNSHWDIYRKRGHHLFICFFSRGESNSAGTMKRRIGI